MFHVCIVAVLTKLRELTTLSVCRIKFTDGKVTGMNISSNRLDTHQPDFQHLSLFLICLPLVNEKRYRTSACACFITFGYQWLWHTTCMCIVREMRKRKLFHFLVGNVMRAGGNTVKPSRSRSAGNEWVWGPPTGRNGSPASRWALVANWLWCGYIVKDKNGEMNTTSSKKPR